MGRSRDHDRALWQAAMRDVKPLKRAKATRSPEASTSHKPAPARTKADAPPQHPATMPPPKPAVTVTFAAPEISHGRAAGVDRRSAERLRRGHLPIDGRLDLHGLTQEKAAARLADFIERAESQGKRCLLVITGKGLASGGILRDQVPRWLNQAPNRAHVLAFDYARPQDGGSGALYVLLKRRREPKTSKS
jgi:DNA-nicking Smr family endonuclease